MLVFLTSDYGKAHPAATYPKSHGYCQYYGLGIFGWYASKPNKTSQFFWTWPWIQTFLTLRSFLRKLVQSLARCIVDIEMDAIFANLKLRLASDNINPDTLEDFLFKNIEELEANSTPFLVSLIKISAGIRDRQAIWGRTLANLDPNNDHKPDNDINSSDDADPNADPEEGGEVILLENNMPCIADHPIIKQGVVTRNKKLVSVISL